MKKTALAALLAALASSAFAAEYFVVVPVPNKSPSAGNVMVSLSGYSVPAGVVGRAYAGFDFNSVLQVLGDPSYSPADVRWSLAGGSLPAGLSLSSSGKLSGNPIAAGKSSFQVLAAYKTKAGEQAYQVLVTDVTVALGTATLPAGEQGAPYTYDLKQNLTVSGDAQYTPAQVAWSLAAGSLPAGLQLNANGSITGVPAAEGTYSFTAQASYLNKAGQQTYQVVVAAISISLATGTPPQGVVSQVYPGFDLKPLVSVQQDAGYAANGAGVTWLVNGGTLPPGLMLDPSAGTVSGTPTASSPAPVSIQATYKGKTASQSYTFPITDALTQYSGYRGWSDGTYAQSCKAYRNPTGNYAYLGATGDGVYRIQPGSAPLDVYCDMTTDGGGWTLVGKLDWKGMFPQAVGEGTGTVCSNLTDGCLTEGTSNFYVGTAAQSSIKDYMFLMSANGFGHIYDTEFLLHSPANYVRDNVGAPGHTLFSLMTDSTPGWHDPADTATDPSDQNQFIFVDANGAAWSDGNWHGCPASGACGQGVYPNGPYPYEEGLQVLPTSEEGAPMTQRWGQHHFSGEPALSGGLYTLQPWTYLGIAGSTGDFSNPRTVPQAAFEAYRWAEFVR